VRSSFPGSRLDWRLTLGFELVDISAKHRHELTIRHLGQFIRLVFDIGIVRGRQCGFWLGRSRRLAAPAIIEAVGHRAGLAWHCHPPTPASSSATSAPVKPTLSSLSRSRCFAGRPAAPTPLHKPFCLELSDCQAQCLLELGVG
jgi:hypothetical protein